MSATLLSLALPQVASESFNAVMRVEDVLFLR